MKKIRMNALKPLLSLPLLALLAGCSTRSESPAPEHHVREKPASKSPVNEPPAAEKPPQKNGKRVSGLASYYADKYQGKTTASGEPFDQNAATAAHRTLPFGTKVKVTNVNNGKSVIVRINDRGPFVKGRIIDLSHSAFARIGSIRAGVMPVEIEVLR